MESQSLLSMRIQQWRDRILPALDDQDARPSFDIHKYASNILDRFPQHDTGVNTNNINQMTPEVRVPFRRLICDSKKTAGRENNSSDNDDRIQSVPQYEVCRHFLATLQLVGPCETKTR
jgi:hypothetical protein